MTKRKPTNKLTIGTYYLAPYARTKSHVQQLSECGIDFIINIPNDKELLDLLSEHDVHAIVNGVFPGWFGGDGSNAGTLSTQNPIEKFEAGAAAFIDHPAIWGIDTGDEPSLLDFPHYGKIFKYVNGKFPHLQPYLNIYPSYAVKGSNTPEEVKTQLGTDDYATYIEEYCKYVDSDYICFDYYPYSATLEGMYHTLDTVSNACKKYNRELWMVLQVNSSVQDIWLSADQLRFQAFTAMAYGSTTLTWACYTAGWWYNHVLDKEGNPTEQYEKLKEVNAEIHTLGQEYMKYQHIHTRMEGSLLIGEMEKTDSDKGYFITTTEPADITFKNETDCFTLYSYNNKSLTNENGQYYFHLEPYEAVFLTCKKEV